MRVVLLGAVMALGVYEGYALWSAQSGDTISELVWHLSERPFFPFVFGVICGHFFWQRRR